LQLEWPANDELAVPVGGKVMRGLENGKRKQKVVKKALEVFLTWPSLSLLADER
jgi:hypothetical protein